MNAGSSWGRYPKAHHIIRPIYWTSHRLPDIPDELTGLPHGLGRSYGDSCLNDGGVVFTTFNLSRFITFDTVNGVLRCEAGTCLDEILKLIVPRGWFLPTTPGTKFVTVGGALANDVHGKNHHRVGTFGCHVTQFELLRSDGERLICSPSRNQRWFAATIAGLGLTGLITWVELKLKKIESSWIKSETVKFGNLDEFFEISKSDSEYEYTVAWIDCLSEGKSLGRGLYMRGNHAVAAEKSGFETHSKPCINVWCNAPDWFLNPLAIRAFNVLYYHKQRARSKIEYVHYDRFFYPLDALSNWNRMYGKRGFLQYQFVVPPQNVGAVREVLTKVVASRRASFLAILKTFGPVQSPGLLSFPAPGTTLALDFPNEGKPTFELLARLDAIVQGCGGRIYPAKDAHMTAEHFQRAYPRWREFSRFIDPKFSSSFWRRVSQSLEK